MLILMFVLWRIKMASREEVVVKKEEIDRFQKALFEFREKLYDFSCDDENLLEVAKMKSKVQHFNTEILEDEEVLSVAYSNEK